MRSHRWTFSALDGLNVTAVGLMAGVTWQLGHDALVDALTVALALAAALVLWRTRLNSAWPIGAGAVVGIVHGLVT